MVDFEPKRKTNRKFIKAVLLTLPLYLFLHEGENQHVYADNKKVAELTIYADGAKTYNKKTVSSADYIIKQYGTHSWISLRNITSKGIDFGNTVIPKKKEYTAGLWGNKSYHVGVIYNLEQVLINYNDAYKGRVSYSRMIDESQLKNLNRYSQLPTT